MNIVIKEHNQKKLHRPERRVAILRGAAMAFVKQGYDATSLEDIVEATGISRALLYRHFDSKKEIYLAIIENTIAKLGEGKPVLPGVGFGNKLTLLITLAQTDPDGFILVFRHAIREPAFQEQAKVNNLLRQQFIESNLTKTITDGRRRQFTARLLRDTILGTLLAWIDSGRPEPERLNNLLLNVIETIIEYMKDIDV